MSAVAVAVGAAASIGSAAISAAGQKSAAAQTSAQARQQYAQDQAANYLASTAGQGRLDPYAQTGYAANSTLAAMLGLNALQEPQLTDFQSPMLIGGKYVMITNQAAYDAAIRNYQAQKQSIDGLKGQVGNLLKPYSMDDYRNDPGYTPMVNSLEELQATPGYQFQLQQGLQSVNNSAAAKGSLLSGGTLKAINDYAQGQASTGFQAAWERAQQAYNNAFNRNLQTKNNAYSMLAGVSGQGLGAVNSGNQLSMQVASNNQSSGANNLNAQMQANNMRANASNTLASGINSGLQGGLSNILLGSYLNQPASISGIQTGNVGGGWSLTGVS